MKKLSYLLRSTFLMLLLSSAVSAQEFDVQLTPSLYAGGYNISCYGANTGSINLFITGGVAPYTYVWADGPLVRNRTNLVAGSYQVTVTSSNGPSVTREITLTEPSLFEVILFPREYEAGYNISENGGSNGEIGSEVRGGVPPYNYLWNNGGADSRIENLAAGVYNVVVHDATNCVANANTILIEPTVLHVVNLTASIHSSGYNIPCNKPCTLSLTVAGGTPFGENANLYYNYEWSNGTTGANTKVNEAGWYTVTATDKNGASVSDSIMVTRTPNFSAEITPFVYSNTKNTSCYNCNNGSIATTITSGSAPYTYTWNNGSHAQNPNGLGAGSYTVVMKDAAGCQIEKTTMITAPEREDWTMGGNDISTTQFIGSKNAFDLVFKSNNIESLRLLKDGGTKFTGDVKLSNTAGKSGMLFMDSDGKLINSEVDPQAPLCGHGSNPIWNSNEASNMIFTCPPTRVGIGTHAFPNYSVFHVAGTSLFEGDVNLGSATDNFTLTVNGQAKIASLNGTTGSKLVQADNDGLLSSTSFGDIKPSVNYWLKHATADELNYIGKIGINTNLFPNGEYLHVSGNSLFNGDVAINNNLKINSFTNTSNEFVQVDGSKNLINVPASAIMSDVNYWKTANGGTDLYHTVGNVGIGTNSPNKTLTVKGDVELFSDGNDPDGIHSFQILSNGLKPARRGISIDNDPSGKFNFYIHSGQNNASFNFINGNYIGTSTDPYLMTINSNGKIGIGVSQSCTYPGDYLLYVAKGIRAEKVTVELENDWSDFVFDKNYSLPKLQEVEKFINAYKHLPGIPSALEVKREGVNVSEMFAIQMQKIEELTLYVIEIKKENQALKEKVEQIEGKK